MSRTINYNLNENAFSEITNISSYWAGFIAADGYIGGYGNKEKEVRYFSFGLKEEDKYQVEKLQFYLNCNKELTECQKEDFISYQLNLTSRKLCFDLETNFNITNNKSLVLTFPYISTSYLKDCFILGYIDGDGCIGMQQRNSIRMQSSMYISIIGTFEFLTSIRERFIEILGREVGCINRKRQNNKNTFVLSLTGLSARKIYLHYYQIDVPKLERKWTVEKYNHCINWKRIPSRLKKI